MEVGQAQVEGAVAQAVGSVDELAPTGKVDGAIRREPLLGAEITDGGLGGRSKLARAGLGIVDGEPERGETRLHVLDGRSLHAWGDRFHMAS